DPSSTPPTSPCPPASPSTRRATPPPRRSSPNCGTGSAPPEPEKGAHRMGRMDGKVVLITGAARGQGRSHALRLAEEGADIIAVDICDHIDSVPFPMGNADDLAETVKQVENLDRRIVARTADVRDSAQLQAALSEGLAEFGHIDVLCANAGIASMGLTWEITEEQWRDVIDV